MHDRLARGLEQSSLCSLEGPSPDSVCCNPAAGRNGEQCFSRLQGSRELQLQALPTAGDLAWCLGSTSLLQPLHELLSACLHCGSLC